MERVWRAAPLASLLVAVSLLVSGCTPNRPVAPASGDDSSASLTASGATSEVSHSRRGSGQAGVSSVPVARLGAALSLTGGGRMIGSAQRNGIKLAQDEINAGGVLGKTRLEVIVDDDGSDREQAAAVFQRFIEDSHVVAILGPTLADAAQNVDPIAQQAAVPVLAISNSASGITQIGNFVFRDNLSESQLTPQVISAVRAHVRLHRAALLYSDTDPNRSGSHGFKAELENAGVHIAAEQTFERDQTDFSTQLEAIAASQPDALFVSAPSSAAAPILIQARLAGLMKVPIIGSSTFNSDAVVRSAGDAAEGLIVGSAWSLNGPTLRNQQFVQSYRGRYGSDPDQVAAQAYTGVYLIANALKVANTASDARAVREALEQTHGLQTPLGAFSFNAAHDPDYPASVQVVREGRFQPY
jgi:branched-chain amino acid transport system substrate-binding protein